MEHERDPQMSHPRPRWRPAELLCATLLAGVMALIASPAALARGHHCERRAMRAHLFIRVRDLDSWEPLSERTLLVWGVQATRAHLIHLRSGVPELADARILTLVDGDHDGLITACGHDAILVTNDGGGYSAIRSMEYLSAKRTAELDRQTWDAPLETHVLSARRQRPRRLLRIPLLLSAELRGLQVQLSLQAPHDLIADGLGIA